MTKAKAWVSALGMILTALSAGLADDVFDINDTTQVITTVVIAAASVWMVYRVPNRTDQDTTNRYEIEDTGF